MKKPVIDHRNATQKQSRRDGFALSLLFAVLLVITWGPADLAAEEDSQQLAVPATFVRFVTTPGIADVIKRPTAMHWDRFHGELLVADSGNNRVVVFAASGSYKYEFKIGTHVTAPADIVTDPQGYIYVLGSNREGRILQRFDFDGLPLDATPLPSQFEGSPVAIRSLACADDGRIYALDDRSNRVLAINWAEGFASSFKVGRAERDSGEFVGLGLMAISGDELLIPAVTEGTILRHGLDGQFLGSIGHFGAKPGALNFPVAVEVSPEGIVAVLDQGRFCVVCYDTQGQVVGEFGGKGTSPGWFMNPSLLAIPTAGKVVIGQIFQNKIQVCALPEFVRGRNQSSAQETASPQGSAETTEEADSRHTSYPFNSPSRGSSDPQNPVTVSHLEVSE